MTEIVTYCGHRVDLGAITPAMIDPRDIAHHLALTNRYGGATGLPYSVAQHSVHVMQEVERLGGHAGQCLAALLHDAHEAYLGDITRPVKQLLGGIVGDFERYLDAAIARRFSLPIGAFDNPLIREADNRLLNTEWIDLGLKGASPFASAGRSPAALKPWRWDVAEERFLAYLDTARSCWLSRPVHPIPTGIIK